MYNYFASLVFSYLRKVVIMMVMMNEDGSDDDGCGGDDVKGVNRDDDEVDLDDGLDEQVVKMFFVATRTFSSC